jgi:UDP-N-acetylmuramoylalanine--D-glutamate ligase
MAHQGSDDVAIVNLMYPLSAEMRTQTAAQVLTVGVEGAVDAVIADRTVIFDDSQVRVGLADTRLNGRHNLQNIAAAGLAVASVGVANEQFREALPTFEPLPHRLQTIAVADGVQYVNDSFATAPEATIAAMQSFVGPLVLIVGGSSKQTDLTRLVKAIDREAAEGKLVGLVAIGQTGQQNASALRQPFPIPVVTGLTMMPEIVSNARHILAAAGGSGTILLSPGAASFGLFSDYKQRGELFAKAVGVEI